MKNLFFGIISLLFLSSTVIAASNMIPLPPKRPAELASKKSSTQKWQPPKEIQDKLAPVSR